MSRVLKTPDAFPGEVGSQPSYNSSPREIRQGLLASEDPGMHSMYRCAHRQNTHTCKINKYFVRNIKK